MSVNPDTIPRYKMPTWAELAEQSPSATCSNCIYYKEISRTQNGFTEFLGACVFEAFQADTFKELLLADIAFVEPQDPACDDYKE